MVSSNGDNVLFVVIRLLDGTQGLRSVKHAR